MYSISQLILAIFSILFVINSIANGCKEAEGWVKFEKYCYKLISAGEKGLSWDEASAKCKSLESHLASEHSDAENEFISNLITKKGDPNQRYWIGIKFMRDNDSKQKIDFFNFVPKWSDGTEVDWSGRVGNVTKGPNPGPVFCIHHYGPGAPSAGAWDDAQCELHETPAGHKLGAVCKAPLDVNNEH